MNTSLGADTKIVRRQADAAPRRVTADICVVGAGIAGVSAALTRPGLGRKVALGRRPAGARRSGGQFDHRHVLRPVRQRHPWPPAHPWHRRRHPARARRRGAGAALPARATDHRGRMYDEVALARWIEEAVRQAGITVGARRGPARVQVDGRRVAKASHLATRYGDVHVEATRLRRCQRRCRAGLAGGLSAAASRRTGRSTARRWSCSRISTKRSSRPATSIGARISERGGGIRAWCGTTASPSSFPGRGIARVNMTHVETPLDPVAASATQLDGRAQADRRLVDS